jgi:hypothetical protein
VSGAWARALEFVLGEPLDHHLTAGAVHRLVTEQVPESEQLDFKLGRYKTTEDGRVELAKDVCAFANRRGGVLVLGVAENNGKASKALPLERVGDPDARHVRNVLGSWCAPVPDIDVIPVPAEPGQSEGFVLVVVPPSARAPHAVAPPQTNSFSWPVRRGTQTIWLSESELADAYRARASRVADEAGRLDELVADAVGRLATPDPWLISVLVPAGSRPGTPIDRQVVGDYTIWFRDIERSLPNAYRALTRNTGIAGPRRVLFTDIDTPGKPFAGAVAELHTDGASVHAQQLHQVGTPDVRSFNNLPDGTRILWEELLAEFALVHLLLLCHHAVDNGGAWGEATVAMLLSDGGGEALAAPVVLSASRDMFHALLGRQLVSGKAPRSTITVDLDAVTRNGTEAIRAARMLGNGLANVFGWPELSQYTADGQVRSTTHQHPMLQAIGQWAQKNGVDLITGS